MKLNRLLQTLIPAAIAIWVPASLWAAAFGGFGDSLDQAKGTHFFQWFHLTQTAQEQAAGSTVTSFKPSGKRFRDLVTFKVTTGRKGDITGMELILSRKFVDSPQDGIFARDIAKSLLRTAFSTGADNDVRSLAAAIEQLGVSTAPIIQHESTKPPKVPDEVFYTPGYLTYLGQRQSYEHAVAGKILRLENAPLNGVKSLTISIRAR